MILLLGSFLVVVEPGSSRLAQKSNLNKFLLSLTHSIGQDVSQKGKKRSTQEPCGFRASPKCSILVTMCFPNQKIRTQMSRPLHICGHMIPLFREDLYSLKGAWETLELSCSKLLCHHLTN